MPRDGPSLLRDLSDSLTDAAQKGILERVIRKSHSPAGERNPNDNRVPFLDS
jgi:hypothetical protein